MMIPHKKTLNTKNNSPWLLCPSKSFPGKFYYFNGSTGETAWCLSDSDKNIKKDTIHKVTDKTHFCPGPFGPPIDESTNTTNSFTSSKNVGSSTDFAKNVTTEVNPRYPIPSPLFGQAVFPKYVSPEIFTPKVIWALTPMYVPNQPSQPHRHMVDRITQTYEPEQPIFVKNSVSNNTFQTINRTMNFNSDLFRIKRNHSTPLQHFDKEKPMFGQTKANFNTFKSQEVQTFSGKPSTQETPKRLRTLTEGDSTPKSALKPSRSVENLTTLFTKDVETTLSPPHKVDNSNASKLSELDRNDLRLLLVAKKKVKSGETSKSADDKSKENKSQESTTPKKRVTFDLQQPGDTSSEEIEQSPDRSQEELSQPAPPSGHVWYVVADTEALLSDFQCIEQYVKRDGGCRLLLPAAVRAQLEARGRGRGGAVAARALLRALAAPPDHIQVQTDAEYEHASPDDGVLQCCWDLLQENTRVVLITNNTEMLIKAKSIDLECHTIKEIKNGYRPLPLPQFDLKKLKIVVNNDKKESENLFMQDISQIKSLSFAKINGLPLQESRMNMFNAEPKEVLCDKDNNSDKFINLTKSKTNMTLNSEVTNVHDQISKHSIADIKVQNRSKLIMKNVFRNTGLNNEIDQDTRNLGTVKKDSYKLTLHEKNDLACKNQDQKSLPNLDIIDEIDKDIRRLNFTKQKPENNRDTIKVSGIIKLNNQSNLDEDLERFSIKNAIVENRVKNRLDEWMCRLNQTMEGVLTDVLLKEKARVKGMPPPWSLFEAIQVIGETFKKQQIIKSIVDKFSMKLLNCSSNNGKLIKNIKPNDFMNLIGFSAILIRHLKDVVPHKEFCEAEDVISDLIRNIEDPNTDIDLTLEKVNTPIISKSDVSDPKVEVAFRKSATEIIDYLKKHFEAWKAYEMDNPKVANVVEDERNTILDKEPHIVRTCGKDLNMLKINRTKTITVENKLPDKVNVSNEPKVTRNVKIIEAFEEKLKKRAELDLDELDYDESVYTLPSDDDNFDDTRNKDEINKVNAEDNEKTKDLTEYNSILDDLSVSESSADTECVRAYPIMRIFLVRLKRTLLLIYNFINESMQEYQDGMSEHRKADVQLKTDITRQYVLRMGERLKSIIARESGDGTRLRDLLIKAGDYVEEDKIITNYKEIIAKYLEQAQILEEALKIMPFLSNTSPKDRDTGYNTLHTSSPILPSRASRVDKMFQLTNGS